MHSLKLQVQKLCKTWLYERQVSIPANLYEAQLALRTSAK